MVRVAVVGLGVIGRQHLRVLRELDRVEIAAVCDSSPEVCRWAADTVGAPVLADWRELMEQPFDALVNALPTGHHYGVTRSFLERGTHVLVEKPIATTVEEARALIAVAQASNVALMVGHVERFNPAVRALKAMIQSGDLGDIVSISARRVGVARPTIPHANVVIDLAIHDIDVFSYLLNGEQARVVFAAGATVASNVLEDHAELVLRYGRTLGSIYANWITPAKIRRLYVTGTNGLAEIDYLAQSLRVYEGAPQIIQGDLWNFFAVSQESSPRDVPVLRREPLEAELEHFIDEIEGGGRHDGSDACEAMRALALALAANDLIRGQST